MAQRMTAIGCISGTSMDGIDVSVVTSNGDAHVDAPIELGPGATYPYDPALRAQLLAFLADPQRAERDPLDALEAEVTMAHVAAVETFMRDHSLLRDQVALVGLHGQTVWHNPAKRFTRQLMDGAAAARKLGITTVTRFRHADVAAGGQGAPLVPLFHRALVASLDRAQFPQPIMVLNWGGVGNVTYIDADTVIAFDTGPASALIDDWMRRKTGQAFDHDGATAAAGRVDHEILGQLMNNPYFAAAAPKSLDRQDFHARAGIVERLSLADGCATLTAFTIEATAAARQHVPKEPTRWLVAGGGRLNATMTRGLAARLGVPVDPVEAVGWNGDHLEAQCFGYLAIRSVRGLPLSLPTTTGVATPLSGGVVNTVLPEH